MQRPIAYSYARCSTARQQGPDGKSLERQLADARKYAEAKGYELSEENIIQEIVSGFRGKNISEEGSLGAFVKKAEGGKLKGSILILEDLDRFSRTDPMVAMQQFTKLINEGVTIATLGANPKEYVAHRLKDQMGDLLYMVIEFFRSNGESRRKSGWAHKKWEKRREMAAEGKVFKMKHPTWLQFVPNEPKSQEGKYVTVEDKAKIVRDIFKQYNGGQSVYAITKNLNRHGVKTLSGKTWAGSLVKYLLRSRSVLGEYQPKRIIDGKRKDEGEPIKGFFPAIVTETVYNRAQARWKFVPTRNGRPPADESDEILSGLIRCPYCGGSIGVQESTQKHLLACNKAFENACARVSVRRHFVEWCAAASTDEIYNSVALGEDNSAKIQAIEGKLAQLSQQQTRLVNLVAAGVEAAEQQALRLQQNAKSLSKELEAERNLELTNEAEGIAFVEAFVSNHEDRKTRLKAMLHIRRFVAKVEVYFLGDRKTYDKYRADQIKEESSGINRGKIWLKLRKKHKIQQKQFVRVVFTRPIEGKTERTFTYQEYLRQMEISGVKVAGMRQ
jgi:hypothetical protein